MASVNLALRVQSSFAVPRPRKAATERLCLRGLSILATWQELSSDIEGEMAKRVAIVTELSAGSLFAEAPRLPKNGQRLELSLRISGESQSLNLPGTVRWLKGGGFGLQMESLGARTTSRLCRLIESRAEKPRS